MSEQIDETLGTVQISICDSLGVKIEFIFVPYSQAKLQKAFDWGEDDSSLRLCYMVNVYKDGNYVLTTPYMSGAAVPNWVRPKYYGKDDWKSARKRVEEAVCELGCCPKQPRDEAKFFSDLHTTLGKGYWTSHRTSSRPEPIFPKPDDVLYCLVMDAQCAYSARTFEEFCSDLGYSNDSIKALKAYESCKDTLVSLMRHFDFEQLCKLFEDY
jgi:hypothetical protein